MKKTQITNYKGLKKFYFDKIINDIILTGNLRHSNKKSAKVKIKKLRIFEHKKTTQFEWFFIGVKRDYPNATLLKPATETSP